jgi:hypothetical protein
MLKNDITRMKQNEAFCADKLVNRSQFSLAGATAIVSL